MQKRSEYPMEQAKIIGGVVYLLFLFAVYLAVAIANGRLAARLDRSVAAWVILSLIPILRPTSYCSLSSTD
jgi:hypothetical protein